MRSSVIQLCAGAAMGMLMGAISIAIDRGALWLAATLFAVFALLVITVAATV